MMRDSVRYKVAIVTRICPHYIVPFYRKLAQKVELTIFFGRGKKTGSQQNAKNIEGFKYYKLLTIPFPFEIGGVDYYVVIHPALLFYIKKGGYDVIISEGATNILNLLFLSVYKGLSKIPLIIRDAGRNKKIHRSIQRKILDPLLNLLYNNADAILSYGEISKDYMISVGIPEERIFVAQNTVDLHSIDENFRKYLDKPDILDAKRAELGISGQKVVLYIGALEKRKKIKNLLATVKRLQIKKESICLLIVGDGPERARLEDYVRGNHIKDVRFLGRIVEGLAEIFLISDVVVQPGYNSLATIEAMAYGRPVVTVAYGGTEYEIIDNNKSGFVVKRDDIQELTDVLKRLMKEDGLRKEIGEAARKRVFEMCSLDKMVTGFKRAIDFVCASPQ